MSGVRLDAARLEYELVRRGWDAADLAQAAGVSQGTLSAARHGKRITQRTLIRLATALSKQPVLGIGADLSLAGRPAEEGVD